MAGEVPPSPTKIRRDRQWRPPTKHKTVPIPRPPPPSLTPQRKASLRSTLWQRPLWTINENKAPSLKSDSAVSLVLCTAVPYQPSSMSQISEHVVYFCPSQQLQNYQSVSFYCADDGYGSESSLFRTQSQRGKRSHRLSKFSTPETDITIHHNTASLATIPADFAEDLPRAAIADLFQRVADYEREHPEILRDSGKVWIRVNSVGRGLSTRIKTLGWPGKRPPSFEPRLTSSVPVRSRMRVYEKPSRMKRVQIAVHDCWRRFRNRSTGRDTELWSKKEEGLGNQNPLLNVSMLSLALPDAGPSTRPQRKISRAHRGEQKGDDGVGMRSIRRDSKMSVDEEAKRCKSSLFLDVYPSDLEVSRYRG